MFGYALSMLISGPLIDIFGKKHVVLGGLTIFFLASLAAALAHNIWFLIIARFFQALGGCCGTVIARVMVKDAYPKAEQIKILAHLSAAMAVCPLFIPVLGGILQILFGFRAVFIFLGLFSLVLLAMCKKEIHEPRIYHFISLQALLQHYKLLLTSRVFIGYSLAISFAWCAYFAFTLGSPFLLQKNLHFNSIFFGIFFAIIVLGYLIGTQLTKRFANEIGWDGLILIATLICLAGSLLLVGAILFFPLGWASIVLPMIIIMVGIGIIIPCTQGAVMQPFPKMIGTASGLFFFIQMLFGGICGLILQSFNQESPEPMAFTIFIASLFLVISFYKLIWSYKTQEQQEALYS